MHLKYRSCNLCGSCANKRIFTEKIHNKNDRMDFHIVKCLECGFIYVNPIDTDYTFSLYRNAQERPCAEELYYDQFEQKRQINELLLSMLECQLAQDARILDIGCGTGAFLFYIMNKFHNLYGIDASRKEASYAQSLGLNVIEGTAEWVDTYFDQQFDAILMSDVLEHLEEPNLVLSKCYDLLRNKGLLLLRIPNGSFQICKAKLLSRLKSNQYRKPERSLIGSGEHLSHFSAGTVTKMLESNGFRQIMIFVSPVEPYKNRVVNFLKGIYNPLSVAVYKTLNRLISNAIVVRCEK